MTVDLDAVADSIGVDLSSPTRVGFDRLGEAVGRRMGLTRITVDTV